MGQGEPTVPSVVETAQRRLAVLETLSDGPLGVRDAVERVDRSRSTVSRAISALEDAGFVDRVDGGYRATLAGRLAAERVRRHFETIDDLAAAGAALAPLAPDAPVGPAMVVGAEVWVADDPAPYRVNEPVSDALREAAGFRSLNATIPEPGFIQQVYERTLAGGLEGEAIISPRVHQALQADFASVVAELVETDRFRLLRADGLRYGLLLVDRPADDPPAFLLTPDEQGRTHGLLANDTPAAREWAEERYRTVRERATDVTDQYRGGDGG